MRRFHLIEIEDQHWCPRLIRDSVTDYLQFIINTTNVYKPILDRLLAAISSTKADCIIDLCSGGGGPWMAIEPVLAEHNPNLNIILTDLHLNAEAIKRMERISSRRVRFHTDPVNALQVPPEFKGFRTLFSSFHHFKPDEAQAIIQDAVNNRRGIAIFEATQRRVVAIMVTALVPLIVWAVTPMIRPVRLSRLIWTYVLPVIPLVVLIDGVVSCLRTYTVEELEGFSKKIENKGYRWEIGEEKTKGMVVPVTYLIGYPSEIE